ncbi:MAG TPA: hypothetical protein DDW91_09085, partial [Shewanella frigidimarina]|nr:hypothetical protein [Shewanella frigidimarina]
MKSSFTRATLLAASIALLSPFSVAQTVSNPPTTVPKPSDNTQSANDKDAVLTLPKEDDVMTANFGIDDGGGFGGGGGNSDNDIFVAPKTYGYNYGEMNNVETKVATLTTDLMGDSLDMNSGALSFTHTDVSIPGNFSIPVQVQRTLGSPDNWYKETRELHNWSLAIPHVRTTYVESYGSALQGAIGGKNPYWRAGRACSGALNDNPSFSKNIDGQPYGLNKRDYWNGDTISIPGQGSATIINGSGGKTNTKQWKMSCVSNNVFRITTPDGTVYVFSELKTREALRPAYLGATSHTAPGGAAEIFDPGTNLESPPRNPATKMRKIHAYMLVTSITDRHGNTVNYNYTGNGQLNSIVASDGRRIDLYYTSSVLNRIVANGRQWTYEYDSSNSNFVVPRLTKVTQPDGQKWLFDYTAQGTNFWTKGNIGQHTQLSADAMNIHCHGDASGKFITITHPGGAVGKFNIAERCLGTANVPEIQTYNPYGQGDSFQGYEIPINSQVYAIDNKTITLPDGTNYYWDYAYSANQGYFFGRSTSGSVSNLNAYGIGATPVIPSPALASKYLNATYVINPDGTKQAYYYDRQYGYSNGNLVNSATFDANNNCLEK